MTIATLQDIITKVRKLTGTGNSLQLTDDQIIDYINSFYLYDFPAEFRSLKLNDVFTINTIKNVNVYPFDYEHFNNVESLAFIDKRETRVYTSILEFYSLFYNWKDREQFALGDGSTGPYMGTLDNSPIIRSVNNKTIADTQTSPISSFPTRVAPTNPATFTEPLPGRVQNILITANTSTGTLNVTDDGDGNLVGDSTAGTINYETGAISGLIFTSAVPSGTEITISYNQANSSRPQAILFYQNQLTLSPVPDAGYTVEIKTTRRPSQALLGSVGTISNGVDLTGVPELLEWWETLAAGASKKVFEDRQDLDGIMMMDKMMNERYSLNESRTYAQIGSQRINTIFSGQLSDGSTGVGWENNEG